MLLEERLRCWRQAGIFDVVAAVVSGIGVVVAVEGAQVESLFGYVRES